MSSKALHTKSKEHKIYENEMWFLWDIVTGWVCSELALAITHTYKSKIKKKSSNITVHVESQNNKLQ